MKQSLQDSFQNPTRKKLLTLLIIGVVLVLVGLSLTALYTFNQAPNIVGLIGFVLILIPALLVAVGGSIAFILIAAREIRNSK